MVTPNDYSRISLQLQLDDADCDPALVAQVRAAEGGARVLGPEHERALFDALPSVIAKRVRAITPNGFVISELELTLSIEGKICGSGVSGNVRVKLAPAS
jgi:hypothetical protein